MNKLITTYLCPRTRTLPVILWIFPCLLFVASHAAAADNTPFQWDSHLSIADDTQHFHQIGFSPDGSLFFGISDQTVYVWRSADGAEVAQFTHEQRAINAALSANNEQLITTSQFRLARIWDVKSGKLLETFGDADHSMRPNIEFVAWPPQGPRAVQTNSDWSLSIFDARTAEQLLHLDQITTRVARLLFSAAGDRIVTTEEDGNIRVFDAETGVELLLHNRHEEQAQIAISPDGQRIVSIAQDGMEVWNVESGEIIRRKDDHGYRSWNSPSFSPDGAAIVLLNKATLDGFQILDVESDSILLALPQDSVPRDGNSRPRYPLQVQFSPDGRSILTSHGGLIRLWHLDDRFAGTASVPVAVPSIHSQPEPTAAAPEEEGSASAAHQPTDDAPTANDADVAALGQPGLPTELAALAAEGRLTVRALRGWDRLPERFNQLILELRQHDIDLLGANQAAVEALHARAADTPALSDRVNELRELAELLASYAVTGADPKQEALSEPIEP